jgi:hypothetical protein
MTIRVVGAGVGRTGTHSLKLALEQLLGGRCYHMVEVLGRPDDVAVWHRAMLGDQPDWPTFLSDYEATVDWPGAAVWRELSDAFPDAIVLLSVRADADAWWRSADRTIFEALRKEPPPEMAAWHEMTKAMFTRFGAGPTDAEPAKAAYERHNRDVRAAIAPERLVEWRAEDGWAPLCAALGVAVPDEPFPVTNTTADFRSMAGLDAPPA